MTMTNELFTLVKQRKYQILLTRIINRYVAGISKEIPLVDSSQLSNLYDPLNLIVDTNLVGLSPWRADGRKEWGLIVLISRERQRVSERAGQSEGGGEYAERRRENHRKMFKESYRSNRHRTHRI